MTQTNRLFTQHIRQIPQFSHRDWLLYIDGTSRNALTLNYNSLLSLSWMSYQTLHVCGSHTPQEQRAGLVSWRGVPLQQLLAQVQPLARTRWVNIHSADGYATSIPIDLAEKAILATHLNGSALSPEHGFPARIILPAHYGYKQPKWVTQFILSPDSVASPSEVRGWDTTGTQEPVVTVHQKELTCRLGETVKLGGYTNAQNVEINVNNTWNPATTKGFHWQARWKPTAPGIQVLGVRARNQSIIMPDDLCPSIQVTVSK